MSTGQAVRAAFLNFLTSQGYDDRSSFDMEAMEVAFDTGRHVQAAAAAAQSAPDLSGIPWRQGRTEPRRNVYACTGEDWKAHAMIGHFDTADLAARAVADHNSALEAGPGQPAEAS